MPAGHVSWYVMAFAWGALWGSFLNVVIYRLPRGRSVVSPGSACGSCGIPVPWYHNVPILSWFILRGRCFSCKASFSIRYPMVEAAVATVSLAIWHKLAHPYSGAPPAPIADIAAAWLLLFVFAAALVAISLIDFDTMRIPDVLSLPPIVLGLCLAFFYSHVTDVTVAESLLGLLIGGGTLLVITFGYFALTGREGMGLGDYRLMAAVGAFLGWRSLLFLLVASASQGIVFALIARVTGLDKRLPHPDEYDEELAQAVPPEEAVEEAVEDDADFRHMAIPFGPFIALAALEWLLFEGPLMDLFNHLVFRPGG